jgi:hypothetical protein
VGVKPSAHGFSGGWLSAAHSYGFAKQLSCSLHQRELQGAQRMSGSERLGPGESAHPIAIPVLGWGSVFSSSVGGSPTWAVRVPAFVLLERSLRPCVPLFAPLRDKVTSSAQSLVPFRPGPAKDRAYQS